eukprot:CAMPEP_0194170226 /NCGR_PEP_ID=MMETSP0154-20130528/4866_1 /TAXON_ID=1049557 /ORGANISM="Thalassiothrix antarctica, Strain L6-D1" /LENGTH=324 /DNA_ID=CAMNT_0038881977 /DNA_START=138 /DNA_END=1112 /DNA_ORIENTATION=+
MASNMEIDILPAAGSSAGGIEFHPLAIVHMSDQYTRITSGGAPLPKDSPVVGLLFGTTEEGEEWEVLDADDIITTDISTEDNTTTIQQQIELHQAVFPQHSVIGWYRVTSSDTEPVAEDLETTQKLQQYFSSSTTTTSDTTDNTEKPFMFCFCQVKATEEEGGGDNENIIVNNDDSSLPITLYQVDGGVLVAIEDWKLETSEVEKIAVETVVREKPRQESGFLSTLNTMESAVSKMKDRLNILIQFLENTEKGIIPFQPRLMRQVQSVVCHLGLVLSNDNAPPNTDSIEDCLPYMAVAAKTVMAVQGYTEKVKLVQEHRSARRF